MVDVVDRVGEVNVAAAKVKRYVCTACGGIYFVPVNEVCPGCKGRMEIKDVTYDANGAAHVAAD